ncbi:MAG: 50S ribosomal protein L23 [Minisyncoccota bacterium]
MALFTKKNEGKKTKRSLKIPTIKKTLVAKPSVLATKLLVRPRITEKAYALNGYNQYVFVVDAFATKKTVKRAIEEVYAVQVVKVRMIHLPGKRLMVGKKAGTRSTVKKAIVSVMQGQSLTLFKAGI